LGRQGFYAEVGVQKGQNEQKGQKGQKGIWGGRFQVIRVSGEQEGTK